MPPQNNQPSMPESRNKFIIPLLIVIIILLAFILLFFVMRKSAESPAVVVPVTQTQMDQNQNGNPMANQQLTTFKIWNAIISYNPNVWELVENRYCLPSEGGDDKKYDGTPCDLDGFTFKFKNSTDNADFIIAGGWQPMSCDVIGNATKCDDTFALVTSSHMQAVLDFYDYILNTLQRANHL